MKLIGVKVGDQMRDRVQKLADSKGVPISSIVRELLEQALSRQDLGQAIVILNQKMEKAAQDIQAVRAALVGQEELIRRAGRVAARTVLTTEELARVLLQDQRKYDAMLSAVKARSPEGKK